MPQIDRGYGHATYIRRARKTHRCNHWKRLSYMDGVECGAAIMPGEDYVESVCAPYYESPYYKVEKDPVRPWIEVSRKPCWHSNRLCLRCAAKELRSFAAVRQLADAYCLPY